ITPCTVFVAVPLSSASRPATTAATTPPISRTARTIPAIRLTGAECSRNRTFPAEQDERKVYPRSRLDTAAPLRGAGLHRRAAPPSFQGRGERRDQPQTGRTRKKTGTPTANRANGRCSTGPDSTRARISGARGTARPATDGPHPQEDRNPYGEQGERKVQHGSRLDTGAHFRGAGNGATSHRRAAPARRQEPLRRTGRTEGAARVPTRHGRAFQGHGELRDQPQTGRTRKKTGTPTAKRANGRCSTGPDSTRARISGARGTEGPATDGPHPQEDRNPYGEEGERKVQHGSRLDTGAHFRGAGNGATSHRRAAPARRQEPLRRRGRTEGAARVPTRHGRAFQGRGERRDQPQTGRTRKKTGTPTAKRANGRCSTGP